MKFEERKNAGAIFSLSNAAISFAFCGQNGDSWYIPGRVFVDVDAREMLGAMILKCYIGSKIFEVL